MSNVSAECCCGGECPSTRRVFVPCNSTVSSYRYQNITMTTDQLNECGFSYSSTPGTTPPQMYIYRPNPPVCDPYCGHWLCITGELNPDIVGNRCHPESPTSPCPSCCLYGFEDPGSNGVCPPYREVRAVEMPAFCSRFTPVNETNDLYDGTCCDLTCTNRSVAICEDGNVFSCVSGDSLRPCECTSFDDLSWNVDISWDPGDQLITQSRDYLRCVAPDCTDAEFVYDERFDLPLYLNMVPGAMTLRNENYCPDGRVINRTYWIPLTYTYAIASPPLPAGYCDGWTCGGGNVWRCGSNNCGPGNVYYGSFAYSITWTLPLEVFVGWNVFPFPSESAQLRIGFLQNTYEVRQVYPINDTPMCGNAGPCWWCLSSCIGTGGTYGSRGSTVLSQAIETPDPDRGSSISLCADMVGSLRYQKTYKSVALYPMLFNSFMGGVFKPPFPPLQTMGTLTVDASLATPDVPDSPNPC